MNHWWDGGTQATVVVDVPVDAGSLRLLRLAAADAAARAGFALDRVEAARLVVDELASVVIDAVHEGRLRVSITGGESVVVLDGVAPSGGSGTAGPDGIVRELLDSSIGEGSWSLEAGPESTSFHAEVTQRRHAPRSGSHGEGWPATWLGPDG